MIRACLYKNKQKLNVQISSEVTKKIVQCYEKDNCLSTSKHLLSQVFLAISRRFIPEPSANSIGATFPANKEQANELTRDIRSVLSYNLGLVSKIFAICAPVKRSYAREPVIRANAY
jgi:hypothetical protein